MGPSNRFRLCFECVMFPLPPLTLAKDRDACFIAAGLNRINQDSKPLIKYSPQPSATVLSFGRLKSQMMVPTPIQFHFPAKCHAKPPSGCLKPSNISSEMEPCQGAAGLEFWRVIEYVVNGFSLRWLRRFSLGFLECDRYKPCRDAR